MGTTTITLLFIVALALIGGVSASKFIIHIIFRNWYRVIGICFILPRHRYMEWKIKREGWKPLLIPDENGKSFTDPDHWVHPNYDKDMTLYGAYNAKRDTNLVVPRFESPSPNGEMSA